jgi:hypothetical protein
MAPRARSFVPQLKISNAGCAVMLPATGLPAMQARASLKSTIEAWSHAPNPMTISPKAFGSADHQYEEIVRLRPWTAADIYEMKALAEKKVGVVKIATARQS